jgi:hypothetical protein
MTAPRAFQGAHKSGTQRVEGKSIQFRQVAGQYQGRFSVKRFSSDTGKESAVAVATSPHSNFQPCLVHNDFARFPVQSSACDIVYVDMPIMKVGEMALLVR